MILLIGLGNPGTQYTRTRHNMGWQVLDAYARSQKNEQWIVEKSLEAEILKLDRAVLVKPVTFMNLSGKAVQKALKKYAFDSLGKKDFHNLFIIYDDLDIEVGKYKLVFGSGPKVHNGINNIREYVGTDQFWHIRIGVDGRKGDRSVDPQAYVLSTFSPEEQELISKVIESIVEMLSQKLSVST